MVSASFAGDDLVLPIDGSQPMSIALVAAIEKLCTQAEDQPGRRLLRLHVSGSPADFRPGELTVALVTKWERVLRRLERLPVTTVVVATGECGGSALDVLLASDFRVGTSDLRLRLPTDGEATWPGMTIYRLVQHTGLGSIRRAILLGAAIDAEQARELRLIDELADNPADAVAALGVLASGVSGKELAIRRQLLFDAGSTSFEDALGSHLAACDRAIRRASVETAS